MRPIPVRELIGAAMAPRKTEASKLEDKFALDVLARKMPTPERQLRFAKEKLGRQWRFDFSWQPYMLAVEIDGLVVRRFGGELVCTGRHTTVQGMQDDCDKHNAAALLGWTVLCFVGAHVRSGEAGDVTYRVLVSRGWKP